MAFNSRHGRGAYLDWRRLKLALLNHLKLGLLLEVHLLARLLLRAHLRAGCCLFLRRLHLLRIQVLLHGGFHWGVVCELNHLASINGNTVWSMM